MKIPACLNFEHRNKQNCLLARTKPCSGCNRELSLQGYAPISKPGEEIFGALYVMPSTTNKYVVVQVRGYGDYRDVRTDKLVALSASQSMMQPLRPLYLIGSEIFRIWKKHSYGAEPYIRALRDMDSMASRYGPAHERAPDLVERFLANAGSWRGPDAKRIKAELRAMVEAQLDNWPDKS